jgi:hypothetical protein
MALSAQFQNINDYVEKNIAPLSEEQLNWKASPKTWSTAECLEHLIVNNTNYFKTFEAVINNTYRQTFWHRTSPFTGFFNKKLLEFTAAEAKTKVKAPPSFSPTVSVFDKNIVQRFLQQQETLAKYFDKLEPMAADKKIIISSPFSGLITFHLDTVLIAFVNHEQRHINQAEKVMHHPQFPKT